MDISQFESVNNNALLEIQRAQRVLDQAQLKMKKFKQQKKQPSSSNINMRTNLQIHPPQFSNIKQYLNYFLNENQQYSPQLQKIKTTAQLKNKKQPSYSYTGYDSQLHNYRRTEKPQIANKFERSSKKSKQYQKQIKITQYGNNFDLKKHTQQQLQKSQLIHLERIEHFYKESSELLDKKLKQLQNNRQKIRKDKVLLLRDNQQLQEKILILRKKRQQYNEKDNNPQNQHIDKLNRQISKLQKKLAKLELQNAKIIKRKSDLQTNMRVCIRNSKQNLHGDIMAANLGSNQNKSKSISASKCPYH